MTAVWSRITVVAAVAFLLAAMSGCTKDRSYPPPVVRDGYAVIDVGALRPGEPQFFTYQHREKGINFFVIDVDGRVSLFLDACKKCYTQKMGYSFEDGYFICRDCDMAYTAHSIENGIGGCYPIKIEGTLEDDKYFIPLTELQAAHDMF